MHPPKGGIIPGQAMCACDLNLSVGTGHLNDTRKGCNLNKNIIQETWSFFAEHSSYCMKPLQMHNAFVITRE